MNRFRIAHVAVTDDMIRFIMLNQLKKIQNVGYDVDAICTAGAWVNDIKKNGVDVKTVFISRKISPFRDILSLMRMYRLFKEEKYDLVHTHSSKGGFIGRIAARLSGIPVIVHTIHGYYFHENMSAIKYKIFVLIEKIAALFTDLIFSQSKEDVNTTLQLGITKKEKIVWLGNGIDLDLFDPNKFKYSINRSRARAEIFNCSDEFVFLCVSELISRKGIPILLKAIKNVNTKGLKTKLLIIGEGEDRIKLEEMSEKLGLRNCVYFLGWREDIPLLMFSADGFVLSSFSEGMPRSIIEAMAMGLPVVATNIRGSRELVKHKETGFLFEAGKYGSLSRIMVWLIKNKDRAKEMGQAGRKVALSEYDENAIVDKIINYYSITLKKN